MAELFQFDPAAPAKRPECLACEEMLTDAVDGLLSDSDQTFFNRHVATCAQCAALLADAQRGAAWLDLLKTPRPEPSAQLFARILAATSEADPLQSALADATLTPVHPVALPNRIQPSRILPTRVLPAQVLPFRPRLPQLGRYMLDPRLAMTAAMAFFSIAVTLSMAGVRLDQLRAGNLNPVHLKHSYYQATASASRRYEGLRVVHVLESRADDLRDTLRDDQSEPGKIPPAPPAEQPEAQPDASHPATGKQPSDPHGVSRNQKPAPQSPHSPAARLLLTLQVQAEPISSSKQGRQA